MTRYVDCRALPPGDLPGIASGDALMLTAWQAARLTASSHIQANSVVVVPDFLNYARLLSTGQAATMLKLSGSLGRAMMPGLRAGIATMRSPFCAAKMDFWTIARALLVYDLALLPSGFGGNVLLHSYLADLAFAFDRRDFVQSFFRSSVQGRLGIQTQQMASALSCLLAWNSQPQVFHFLLSSRDPQLATLRTARQTAFYEHTAFLADISNWPHDLQREFMPPADFPASAGWSINCACK